MGRGPFELRCGAHDDRCARVVVVDDDVGFLFGIDFGEISMLRGVVADVEHVPRRFDRAELRRISGGLAVRVGRFERGAEEHDDVPRGP